MKPNKSSEDQNGKVEDYFSDLESIRKSEFRYSMGVFISLLRKGLENGLKLIKKWKIVFIILLSISCFISVVLLVLSTWPFSKPIVSTATSTEIIESTSTLLPSKTSTPAPENLKTPTITKTQNPSPTEKIIIEVCVSSTALWIRLEPDANSQNIGGLLNGDCVLVDAISLDGNWFRLFSNEDIGWININYVETDDKIEGLSIIP